VIYNIPDSLAPYLEYIPEDILVGIITDALTDKIFSKPGVKSGASLQQVDMNQIMEQIQSLINNPAPTKSVEKEEAIQPVVFSSDDEDIDDDLKSLVEDFASGLFK